MNIPGISDRWFSGSKLQNMTPILFLCGPAWTRYNPFTVWPSSFKSWQLDGKVGVVLLRGFLSGWNKFVKN